MIHSSSHSRTDPRSIAAAFLSSSLLSSAHFILLSPPSRSHTCCLASARVLALSLTQPRRLHFDLRHLSPLNHSITMSRRDREPEIPHIDNRNAAHLRARHDDEANFSVEELDEALDKLTEKRATTREEGLHVIYNMLSHEFRPQAVSHNPMTLGDGLLRSITSSTTSEAVLACRVLSLVAITVGAVDSDFGAFDDAISSLSSRLASLSSRTEAVVRSYIETLAVLVFATGSESSEHETLELFLSLATRSGLAVVQDALNAWSLIVSGVSSSYVCGTIIPEYAEHTQTQTHLALSRTHSRIHAATCNQSSTYCTPRPPPTCASLLERPSPCWSRSIATRARMRASPLTSRTSRALRTSTSCRIGCRSCNAKPHTRSPRRHSPSSVDSSAASRRRSKAAHSRPRSSLPTHRCCRSSSMAGRRTTS